MQSAHMTTQLCPDVPVCYQVQQNIQVSSNGWEWKNIQNYNIHAHFYLNKKIKYMMLCSVLWTHQLQLVASIPLCYIMLALNLLLTFIKVIQMADVQIYHNLSELFTSLMWWVII
jgi:hypothetical protein